MPPALLFDISGIDLDKVLYDQEVIRQCNPQRGDMEHLNGIVYTDAPSGRIIGYKDVRDNEFWVPGHIPGRPLLPGVIMIEAAAQLASFYTKKVLEWQGFIGFGSVDECKFRMQVCPGCRLYLVGEKIWERHRRLCCRVQGLVKGQLAFDCSIVGTQM
jgi:3-hydroxyacyl-[acyl-carrier-protein] dehydratase